MSTLGRNGITTKYQQDIPTNSNEEVSAEDVRGVLADFNDSKFNLTDDDLRNVKDGFTLLPNIAETSSQNRIEKLFKIYGKHDIKVFFAIILLRGNNGSSTTSDGFVLSNNPTASVSNTDFNDPSNRVRISFTNNYGLQINSMVAGSSSIDLENIVYGSNFVEFFARPNTGTGVNGQFAFEFRVENIHSEYVADL